jgi:hypothetical protein
MNSFIKRLRKSGEKQFKDKVLPIATQWVGTKLWERESWGHVLKL